MGTSILNTFRLNSRQDPIIRAARWKAKTTITKALPHYIKELPNILHAYALAKG